MKTATKYLLIGVLIILTSSVYSQSKKYLSGYVILETGDTVYGNLKVINNVASCMDIKYSHDSGNKMKFKMKEVSGYKRGDEVYVKKLHNRPEELNSYTYMKLIEDGYVKLYECYYQKTNNINNGTSTTTTYTTVKEYYVERDGVLMLVTKAGFKNTIADYFATNKKLSEMVRSKKIKYKDIEHLVKSFNTERKE